MAADTIQEAIITYLKSQATVTAIFQQRIYWTEPTTEKSAKAYCYLKTIDHPNDQEYFSDIDTAQPLMDMHCISSDPAEAFNGANAIEKLLNLFEGTMDGIVVTHIATNGPIDLKEIQFENLYDFMVEINVWNFFKP